MPGTDSDSPDELTQLETELTSDVSQETDHSLDVFKPTQTHGEGAEGTPGETRAQQPAKDWKKEYVTVRTEMDKTRQRMNQVEGILRNPKLAALAQDDPELAEALAKVGFRAAEQKVQQESDRNRRGDGEPSRIDVIEEKFILNEEFADFQEELGRRLKPEERAEIKGLIAVAPALKVAQAWKLTKSYERSRQAAEEKRIAEATKRNPGAGRQRPAPNPSLTGSSKVDLSKDVTQMNEHERQEKIREIIAQNQ